MAANTSTSHRYSMNEVAVGFQTKSDKIRALTKAGYSRSEIADFLGIRYQHVRNVLVNDERVASGVAADTQHDTKARDVAANPKAAQAKPSPTKVRIELDGRVTIPPEFRRALGLKENDPVVLTLEDDEVRMTSLPVSVRRAQAIIRQIVPASVSLVDELLAERRLDAEREDDNG